MTSFRGWEASAAWEDFKFGMQHMSDIERIAMVEESWRSAGLVSRTLGLIDRTLNFK